MESEYYLRIENNTFGFLVEEIHEIEETDILITNDDYNTFFELQSQGKQYRVKEIPTGDTLFDYIEEYIPEVIPEVQLPSETDILKEKVNVLERENADLLLDSALKDSKIENLQNDIADIMKEMAKGGQI